MEKDNKFTGILVFNKQIYDITIEYDKSNNESNIKINLYLDDEFEKFSLI